MLLNPWGPSQSSPYAALTCSELSALSLLKPHLALTALLSLLALRLLQRVPDLFSGPLPFSLYTVFQGNFIPFHEFRWLVLVKNTNK